jgi:hypothetical protein
MNPRDADEYTATNPRDAAEYIAQLIDAAPSAPTGEDAHICGDPFDDGPAPNLSDHYNGPPSPHEPEIFDVDTINRAHALLIMGSQAVVVMERPDGPVKDRVRFLKLDAFKALFANRHTEVLGAARKLT